MVTVVKKAGKVSILKIHFESFNPIAYGLTKSPLCII